MHSGMWEPPKTPPSSKATRRASISLVEREQAVKHCRQWIEECTGETYQEQDFRKLLQDGVVLCRLVQQTCPGLIKKINRGKTTFAHRDNLGFFLSACQKLGLKGGQLFDLEDLQEVSSAKNSASESKIGRDEQERRLRNVVVTIYWFGRTVNNNKEYSGPQLDLSAFGNIVSPPRSQTREKQQPERKRTSPISSIKVTSRKVPQGSISRHSSLPRYNSVDLLISPSPSETKLSEIVFSSPYSSRESLNSTSQHELSAASPSEPHEPRNLSLDLSRRLFTQTVIVGVKSPVRSQSFDSFRSTATVSAEEDVSPISADLSDKGDLGSSSDTRGLQVITEEEEKAAKEKEHASADLVTTSPPSDDKKATEVVEEATVDQDSFQPITFTCPETSPTVGDTCTPDSEKSSLDSCVPDKTRDEREMSGRRRMIVTPSAYEPRKEKKQQTPTVSSKGSEPTNGVTSPKEKPPTPKEGPGVLPAKEEPAVLPAKEGPGVLPAKEGPAVLPAKEGPAVLPAKEGPAVLPAKEGPAVLPAKEGPAVLPAKEGPAVLPAKEGPAVLPAKEGPAVLPAKEGPAVLPAKEGPGVLPAKEGPAVLPPKSQPDPEAASESTFRDMALTLHLQSKETKYGFQLADAVGSGGFFPIDSITPGSPASRTDLRPSDLVIRVNNTSTAGLRYKQVTSLIKKASGKKAIQLTLRRYSKGGATQTQPQGACSVEASVPVAPSVPIVTDSGVSENGSTNPPTAGYETPNIVEVETGTVPELQHAQKVIYPVPSKDSDEVFTDDVIPIINPTGDMSLFGGQARSVSMGSLGSEEAVEEEATEKPRLESLMASVLKETEQQATAVSNLSPPPASSPEVKKAGEESPSTPMQRYLDAKRMKDREIRRQQIDEGAKVYQNVQRNGRRWSKTDSLPNRPLRRNNSADLLQGNISEDIPRGRAQTLSTSVSSLDGVSDLPGEKVKEEKVTDILKRLSISFRPLPAFEDDGDAVRKEAPADTAATVPQAIHTGSDSESVPQEGSATEREGKGAKMQPAQGEKKGAKPEPARGEEKEVGQQLTEEKQSYGERMEALLLAIRAIHSKVGTEEDEEDLQSLERVISSPEMRKAVEMDEMMQGLVHNNGTLPKAVSKHLIPTSVMFRSALKQDSEPTEEIEELKELLRNPFVQGLFFCHDKVATKDFFVPDSTPAYFDAAHPDLVSISPDALHKLSNDPLYRKEQAVTIEISRTDRPLGMLVQCEENGIFIWQLLQDCDAAQSDKFQVGDEVLEVNGITMSGMTTTQAMKVLMGLAVTHMTFSIIPTEHPRDSNPALEPSFVRSHFDYDPMLDEELPCREMGLEFRRGDIIEVINQDDVNWWQARIVDELGDCVPGLIPAKHLQEKRIALQHTYRADMSEMSKPKKWGLKALLPLKKKKKKTYYNQDQFQDGMGGEGILVYEDVVKLQPSTDRNRPIVVIGAPGIGRKTLVRKLIESDSEHFSTCVPHTSRTMRPGEVNGKDYYFVSREQMEREIRYGHFLEHGEHKGNLYGVSIETVMKLMKEGKVPVLDLHPQSLQILRSSTIMPYTVFIKAPPLDRLVVTRQATPSRKGKRDSSGFSEVELEEIHRTSHQLELSYGHFFDWIIVNDDLSVASDFLIEMAKRIEVEVQWVPASWCQDRAI